MRKKIARVLIVALLSLSTVVGPQPSFALAGFLGPVQLNMIEEDYDDIRTFHLSFETDVSGLLYYAITPLEDPPLTPGEIQAANTLNGTLPLDMSGVYSNCILTLEEYIPSGSGYKLEMTIRDGMANLYPACAPMPFYSITVSDLSIDAYQTNGFEILARSNVNGNFIAKAYSPGTVSTYEDLQTQPIAMVETPAVATVTKLIVLVDNALQPNTQYDVLMLFRDPSNAVHYFRNPSLTNPLWTDPLLNRLLSVSYDNRDQALMDDDRLELNLAYPVTDAGDSTHYTVSFIDEFPHNVTLLPSDFSVSSSNNRIYLTINSTGLVKYNSAALFDYGLVRVEIQGYSALQPEVSSDYKQVETPLNQTIIHMPNLPRLTAVAHSDNGTPTLFTDDSLNIVYDQTLDWVGHTTQTYVVEYLLPQINPEQFNTLVPTSDYQLAASASPSTTNKLNLSSTIATTLSTYPLVIFKVSLNQDFLPMDQDFPTIDPASSPVVISWSRQTPPTYTESDYVPPNGVNPNAPPPTYFDPSNPNAPPPDVTPEQIDQITQALNQLYGPGNTNPTTGLPSGTLPNNLISNQLNQLNQLLGESNTYTDTQLFRTLIKLDDTLNAIEKSLNDPTKDPTQILRQIETMTQNVESKMAQLENPVDALTVAEQYITSLTGIKEDAKTPMTTLNQSIEGMLNDINTRLGTVKVEGPVLATQPVEIKLETVQRAIDRQEQFADQIQALSDKFFGEDSTRKVVTSVVLTFDRPAAMEQIQTLFKPEIVNQLKDGNVDQLSMSVGGSKITLPSTEVKPASELIIKMEFKTSPKPQTTEAPTPTTNPIPTQIVEFTILENGQEKDAYQQPLELRFELRDFGVTTQDGQFAGIYRLNEATGVWSVVGGSVDYQLGVIYVKRSSLSQYTVMKSKKSFSDSDTSWAKSEINALLNKGIVEESTNFQPKALLTRAEFASWIAKAYGLAPTGSKPVPFSDIKPNDANYDAVAAVYQMGIIAGKSAKKFDPNGNITADEMAVIIGKTLVMFDNKQANEKVKSKHLASLKEKSTASWAEGDQALLMELGIASGEAFAKGNGFVTKETAAATFSKFYNS